jgi:hypothetical protein
MTCVVAMGVALAPLLGMQQAAAQTESNDLVCYETTRQKPRDNLTKKLKNGECKCSGWISVYDAISKCTALDERGVCTITQKNTIGTRYNVTAASSGLSQVIECLESGDIDPCCWTSCVIMEGSGQSIGGNARSCN